MRENIHPDPLVADRWVGGRVVAGRYRLRSVVGAGATGVVWRAVDLRLDRPVALKQLKLRPGLSSDLTARARQRVFREARIAARLQHPHAVAVYDVTTDDHGRPMLVLEYIPAHSLATALAGHGPLRPARVARIGAAVASALTAAHAAGIVHRDVKPANILLAEDGHAKITDFGLSHVMGDAISEGQVAGTPVFLSPEAALGDPPSPESDVFSLGATLYMAVEGTPPFGVAEDSRAQLERVADGQAPPPRQAGPLTGLLTRMLRDDPAERPHMAEVAAALASIAAGEEPSGTQSVMDTLPAPGQVRARSRRLVHAALGLLAVGVLALLTVIPLTSQDDDGGLVAAPPAATSSRSATPSSTAPSATAGTPPPAAPPAAAPPPDADPAQFQRVVTEYYTVLSDDPDKSWALLGPAMQAQDRAGYERLWGQVKDLLISTAPRVSGNTVVVEIEYTQGGRRVRETHQHDILLRDGTPLINSDQVLSSDSSKKNGT